MMSPTLILASSDLPPPARQRTNPAPRPRVDYPELAGLLGADVIDLGVYDRPPLRWLRRFDRALRLAWGQAWYALRRWRGYGAVYSFSEDIGIPLALLLRIRGWRPRQVLIAHNLCSRRKVPAVKLLGGLRGLDAVVTMSRAEQLAIGRTYDLPPEKLVFLPNRVDEQFWRPQPVGAGDPRLVLSLGLAKRDYPTLIEALGGTPATLHIQASSQWHVQNGGAVGALPANVRLGDYLDPVGLRDLIARCAVVALALRPEAHGSAGSETVLEAMAMAKPVVMATDNPMVDYVRPGETGLVVPSGDAEGLRAALLALLDDPQRARAMGRRAREIVEREVSFDERVDRLALLALPAAARDSGNLGFRRS